MLFCRRFLFPLLSIYALPVGAVATNQTIDDTIGDSVTGSRPIYLPATVGDWEDATCKGCSIKPDKSRAFNGTWTAATYNPGMGSMSIELSFKGTAIYVFFILAGIIPDITTETACNFTLDGRVTGTFHRTPSTASEFQYDALVYSEHNLRNVDHKLIISTSADHDVFVNFDYAIYTADDTPTLAPRTPGGAAGGRASGRAGATIIFQTTIFRPTPTPTPTFTPTPTPTPRPTSATPIPTPTPTPTPIPTSTTPTPTPTPTPTETTPSPPIPSATTLSPSLSVPDIETSTTSQTSQSSLPSKNNDSKGGTGILVGAIVGGAIGGLVFLVALILLFLSCQRRRRRALRIQGSETTPQLVPFDSSGHSFSDGSTVPFNSASLQSSAPEVGVSANYLKPLQPNVTGTTRRARQQGMWDLTMGVQAENAPGTSERPQQVRSEDVELTELREQLRLLREQIDSLQTQSDWAQGLSYVPPPGYSAPSQGAVQV